MFKKIAIILLLMGVLLCGSAALIGWYAYNYYARDLPQIDRVTDYRMNAVSSVYAADGTMVAEFFEEQRYPITIDEIPEVARNAFLAAEDANFYSHPGIDFFSILRALVKNIKTGTSGQGGSTITQQVVKNILLTREKTYGRKIKEAILAYRLEKKLTKNDILELYLNQIFFGNRAYGIKAAALNYFAKNVDQLTIAEAAMLAGLPQAPSRYSPISNMKAAKIRQRYVLNQMVKAGFISTKTQRQALEQKIIVNRTPNDRLFAAPYYVTEVRRLFEEQWRSYKIDLDGLKIYTALDLQAYQAAQTALTAGLREVDKRQGWRGPLRKAVSKVEYFKLFEDIPVKDFQFGAVYPALVNKVDITNRSLSVQLADKVGVVSLKQADWSKKVVTVDRKTRWSDPLNEINIGDVVEVGFNNSSQLDFNQLKLEQTPRLEGAVVIIDPHTGYVLAAVGGYDYRRSQFNRATQGKRQPGSAFKSIIYLAAIDGHGYTPATIVIDEPKVYRVGESIWSPANYDREYEGAMTLRTALEKSRNSVAAELLARVGPESAIAYARKLGIESPLGANLSLSLGSGEVTVLEITRAYGVFASRGVLFPSVLITRIEDRYGQIIFDYQQEKLKVAEQVISPASAFVMANMLKGVVEYGTGTKIKELKRPAAGKTGTSNQQMDTWFVGFTPDYACGVWVGHDEKESIGHKETGGRVSAPIWLHTMQAFLEGREQKTYQDLLNATKEEAERLGIEFQEPEPIKPLDFSIPEGVEPTWIIKATGQKVEPNSAGSFLEYFLKGSGPNENQVITVNEDYWTLPDF